MAKNKVDLTKVNIEAGIVFSLILIVFLLIYLAFYR